MGTVAHALNWSIFGFEHNLRVHWCIYPILALAQKWYCGRNWHLAMCAVLMDNSSAAHKSWIVTCQFSKISSAPVLWFLFGGQRDHNRHCARSSFWTLCTTAWYAAFLLCHHLTPLSTGSAFGWGETCAANKNRIASQNSWRDSFPMWWPFHINVSHE